MPSSNASTFSKTTVSDSNSSCCFCFLFPFGSSLYSEEEKTDSEASDSSSESGSNTSSFVQRPVVRKTGPSVVRDISQNTEASMEESVGKGPKNLSVLRKWKSTNNFGDNLHVLQSVSTDSFCDMNQMSNRLGINFERKRIASIGDDVLRIEENTVIVGDDHLLRLIRVCRENIKHLNWLEHLQFNEVFFGRRAERPDRKKQVLQRSNSFSSQRSDGPLAPASHQEVPTATRLASKISSTISVDVIADMVSSCLVYSEVLQLKGNSSDAEVVVLEALHMLETEAKALAIHHIIHAACAKYDKFCADPPPSPSRPRREVQRRSMRHYSQVVNATRCSEMRRKFIAITNMYSKFISSSCLKLSSEPSRRCCALAATCHRRLGSLFKLKGQFECAEEHLWKHLILTTASYDCVEGAPAMGLSLDTDLPANDNESSLEDVVGAPDMGMLDHDSKINVIRQSAALFSLLATVLDQLGHEGESQFCDRQAQEFMNSTTTHDL